MARQFPLANNTFSVYPRNQNTKVGNNTVPVAPSAAGPVATGESVLIRDLQGVIVNGKGVVVFDGVYRAATHWDTVINLGDILADEAEMTGNVTKTGEPIPVKYEVTGKTVYGKFYSKLHLKRTDVGA